jgi:hypothetical protein
MEEYIIFYKDRGVEKTVTISCCNNILDAIYNFYMEYNECEITSITLNN